MFKSEAECLDPSNAGCFDSDSEVSEDSEPEVDETDDVSLTSLRPKRSTNFPSTSRSLTLKPPREGLYDGAGGKAEREPLRFPFWQRQDLSTFDPEARLRGFLGVRPTSFGLFHRFKKDRCTSSSSPPGTAKKNSRPKWLPPGYRVTFYEGNPVYGFRMQLYCRTGYLLAIFSDQKVRGINEEHPNALVEFSSVDFGEVRIKGLQANLFLAMNKKGRLYGEVNGKDEATVFVEYVYGQYNLYLSRKWAHLGWYVGIKKSGKIKPGHQTRYGQKAIQFLPRRKRYW